MTERNLSIRELKEKVKIQDVEKAVKGVIKLRTENPKLQNQLFTENFPLFLQISCVKIPEGHPKILRIPLPHSVLTTESEICLIVPEVKGIKNIEHEKHVEHYEELLRNKDVTNINKIMTCHELRTEYETFEQRSRLVDLYDIFLVDGRVSGKVVKKCGKFFYKKRKVPIPVKLQASKLKEHINKSLSKVFFFLHLKGNSYTVQFGHNKMKTKELVENIYAIIEFLDKHFPGGFANIKGMQIYGFRATSIPIYLSLKSPNEVDVPDVVSKRPKAYKIYKDELTTLHNATVTVKPTGEVLVKRIKGKTDIEDNIITASEIIEANGNEERIGDEKRKPKKSRKRKQGSEVIVNEPMQKKKKITNIVGDKKGKTRVGKKKAKKMKAVITQEISVVDNKKAKKTNRVINKENSVKMNRKNEKQNLNKKHSKEIVPRLNTDAEVENKTKHKLKKSKKITSLKIKEHKHNKKENKKKLSKI